MADHIVAVFMESCTNIPMDEVQQVKEGIESGVVHPMDAKKRLAREIVRLYHGEEAAEAAQRDFEHQFQERGLPTDMPVVPLARARGDKANERGEIGILDLLINSGLAPNRKHAQRLVEQGGVRINDKRITDREHAVIPVEGMIIRSGRNFVRIVA